MNKETYETIIAALTENIKHKEDTIFLQEFQIKELKKKLEDAERIFVNNKERIETR